MTKEIVELVELTRKPRDEIIDFVQSNIIGYTQLKDFYLAFGRFPTQPECKIIHKYGAGFLTCLRHLKKQIK